MTIGHFAGAFADAWASQVDETAQRKLKDQFAKQQAKLLEIQLQSAETVQDAQQRVDDMMSGITRTPAPGGTGPGLPRQEINLGTPGEPVPNTTNGMDINEMIQNPQGLSALLASKQLDLGDLLKEQGMQATREQNQGMLDQFGSPDTGDMVPIGVTMTPNGPRLDFGPNPQTTPLTPDQASLWVDPEDGTPAIPGMSEQQYIASGKIPKVNYEARQNKRKIQDASVVDLKNAKDIMRLQKELMEFAPHLAPGQPAPDLQLAFDRGFQAVKDYFKGDTKKAREYLAKRNELEKKMSIGVLTSISQFNEAGTITDVKFDQIKKSNPNMEIESAANLQIIAGQLTETMMEADRVGIELPNRKEMEQFVRDVTGADKNAPVVPLKPATNDQEALELIPKLPAESIDALMLNPEQVQMLDKAALEALLKNPNLSGKSLDAAEARWNELHAN